MKKVFVTGGTGFIGSNLIDKLNKQGYHVVNYDINTPQYQSQNINIKGDILDYPKLVRAMEGADIVCHLAAMVGVVDCINNEKKVYRTNYEGVKNIINACIENNIKNVVFASSSEVYGEGYVNEKLYENLKLNPKSVYGITKMKSEEVLRDFSMQHNAKVTVLRYCNIYGKTQRKEFVIPIFINQVLNEEDITVCGNGNQIRTFTYVCDAVDGTIKAINREKGERYEIFNICSNYPSKIIDIAKKTIELNNNKGSIKYVNFEDVYRITDIEVINRIPSGEKAELILGFIAKTKLDEGLKEIFKYYTDNMEGRNYE